MEQAFDTIPNRRSPCQVEHMFEARNPGRYSGNVRSIVERAPAEPRRRRCQS